MLRNRKGKRNPVQVNSWGTKLLLLVIGLDCVGVVAIWAFSLSGGAFEQGIFEYQLEGTVPAFHLAAEFAMAVVAFAGVVGTWRRHSWGTGVLLFGLGMLSYSAVNSLGWALHNDPATAVPMIATLALAVVTLLVLPRHTRGRIDV